MMLRAESLSVTLGQSEALRDVSIAFDADDLAAIVGPNGSGKSTLVRTLSGVVRPGRGRVLLDDTPLRSIPVRRRAARLGLLTQSAATPPLMTVREHIGLGRHAARSWPRRWSREDERVIGEAVEACEVGHLEDRKIEDLSGGERQRVRLATLLAQNPAMLLLDEPLTGLDIEHQLGLIDTLRGLNERGKSIVCVLHDLGLALRFFQRVVVLHEGSVAGDGPPSDVFRPALFRSVFGVHGRTGREPGGTPVVVCHHRKQRPRDADRKEQPEAAIADTSPVRGARANGAPWRPR